MTRQDGFSENYRSVAGAVLIALGLHILSGSVDTAAIRANHVLGTISSNAFRILPSFLLPASKAVQTLAAVHQGCLLALLRVLILFWSLLLVIVGTMFLEDAVTEEITALPTNYFGDRHLSNIFENRDMGCRFRSLSFDV
jgi:uncharacterized membrane protein